MVPEGCLHEIFSVASQGEFKISSVAGQAPSLDRHHSRSPGLMVESTKCSLRRGSPPPRTQHSNVYRRLKHRLGHSLRSKLYQRTVVRSGKISTHRHFGIKNIVLGPKTLQVPMSKSNSPSYHRKLDSSSLHQQTGRDSLSRNVRPPVENHELVSLIQNVTPCQTPSRVSQCDRRFTVQIDSNSINKVVTAPSSVQKDLQHIVHAAGGPVCHMSKPQPATVCLSNSRSASMEHRCSKHKLVRPCSLCVSTNSSTIKSGTKSSAL